MVNDVVIFGAGGFAREVLWTIDAINQDGQKWNVIGLLDDRPDQWGKSVKGLPILDPNIILEKSTSSLYIANGVGDCLLKYKIKKRFSADHLRFATLIHPSAIFGSGALLDGEGIIVQAGSILAPDCIIKSYVTINLDCTIGHDAVLNEYVTVAPGAHISGFVSIGSASNIGTGVAIRERVTVGKGCVIGANASVVKDIPDYSVAVGVPSKVIKEVDWRIDP